MEDYERLKKLVEQCAEDVIEGEQPFPEHLNGKRIVVRKFCDGQCPGINRKLPVWCLRRSIPHPLTIEPELVIVCRSQMEFQVLGPFKFYPE